MTPAVVALETAGIAHTIHEYDRGDDLHDFGREAADSLGLDHDQVFKTLVVVADDELVVAIVPVSCQLSMKRVAAAVGGLAGAVGGAIVVGSMGKTVYRWLSRSW